MAVDQHKEQTERLDSLKDNSSWGGKRDRAGRPRGSMNNATKERVIAEAALKQRIVENSQRILDKQLSLAEGVQYLMVIKTETDSKGKRYKSKPEIVTDEEVIRDYLDGKLNETGDEEYYFITTERPDTRVLDSLLDRVFGKATQQTNVKVNTPADTDISDEELSKLLQESDVARQFIKGEQAEDDSRAVEA